jgi:hypothetical protein
MRYSCVDARGCPNAGGLGERGVYGRGAGYDEGRGHDAVEVDAAGAEEEKLATAFAGGVPSARARERRIRRERIVDKWAEWWRRKIRSKIKTKANIKSTIKIEITTHVGQQTGIRPTFDFLPRAVPELFMSRGRGRVSRMGWSWSQMRGMTRAEVSIATAACCCCVYCIPSPERVHILFACCFPSFQPSAVPSSAQPPS